MSSNPYSIPAVVAKMTAAGISSRALARHLRADKGQVSRWLRGVHRPRIDSMEKIVAAVDAIVASLATSRAPSPPTSAPPSRGSRKRSSSAKLRDLL